MTQLASQHKASQGLESLSLLLPNGGAAAALLAVGIGCCAFGLLTLLVEAVAPVGGLLAWYQPTGSLSGLSTLTVGIWLSVWLILHQPWKNS